MSNGVACQSANMGIGTYLKSIANEAGIVPAAFISHVWYWMKRNELLGKNIFDGKVWTYSSAERLSKYFTSLSVRQIRLVIQSCIKSGLLIKTSNPQKPWDKTSWYTLTPHAIELCRSDENHLSVENFHESSRELSLKKQLAEKEKIIQNLLKERESSENKHVTYLESPCYKNVTSLIDIHKEIPNTVCIKEFSLIGNPQSSDSTIANPTLLKKQEQAQDPILDHMLANPYGCSLDKVKAYRAHRGYRMTIKAWDSAVKVYLEICFKQSTPISPDDALDALLARTDCCTDFDTIFPQARQAANIRAFDKEATGYHQVGGQSDQSYIADLKRIGITHNLPEDFDYQAYYAERGRKEAEERDAETLRTSNAHHNPSSGNNNANQQTATLKSGKGSYEISEPAHRAAFQAEISPEVARMLGMPESDKTPSKINSEITVDDSKGCAVESQERTVMLSTELCEEPIAIVDCDSALNVDVSRTEEVEELVRPKAVRDIIFSSLGGTIPKPVERECQGDFGGYPHPLELLNKHKKMLASH